MDEKDRFMIALNQEMKFQNLLYNLCHQSDTINREMFTNFGFGDSEMIFSNISMFFRLRVFQRENFL